MAKNTGRTAKKPPRGLFPLTRRPALGRLSSPKEHEVTPMPSAMDMLLALVSNYLVEEDLETVIHTEKDVINPEGHANLLSEALYLTEFQTVPRGIKNECFALNHGVGHMYQPISPSLFINLLAEAFRLAKKVGKKKVKFVDAGCGAGLTLVLASLVAERYFKDLDVELHGVEIQGELIALARGRARATIHAADLCHFDYSPYDIIYAFNPVSLKAQAILKANWAKACRPGTLFLLSSMEWETPEVQKVSTVKIRNGTFTKERDILCMR